MNRVNQLFWLLRAIFVVCVLVLVLQLGLFQGIAPEQASHGFEFYWRDCNKALDVRVRELEEFSFKPEYVADCEIRQALIEAGMWKGG